MPQHTAIGERLRYFAQTRFGSVAGLARALGKKTAQELYAYLRGDSRPGPLLQEQLRNAGCDIEWLMTGRHLSVERDRNDADYVGELGVIPVYGYFDADPDAGEQFEQVEGIYYPFFKGNFFALIVRGDSMIHARLPSGREGLYPDDLVIFEKNRHPKSGDIVAVELSGGKRMVKIFTRKRSHEVILNSANRFRNYPGITVREDEVASWGVYVNHFPLDENFKRRMGIRDQQKG